MKFLDATLETISDGAAIAKFNHELRQAIENCLDINKDPSFKRVVRLEVKITPDQERKSANIDFIASSKLAPDAAGSELMYFTPKGQAMVANTRQLTLDELGIETVEEFDEAKGGE